LARGKQARQREFASFDGEILQDLLLIFIVTWPLASLVSSAFDRLDEARSVEAAGRLNRG